MTDKESVEKQDLIVPIYIDTNALLDLMASIENGFSLVEKIGSHTSRSDVTNRKMDGEFGVANVLSMLKVGFTASKATTASDENTDQREYERFHTYGSLLHRLLGHLNRMELLTYIDSQNWDTVQLSGFVELRGYFRRHPVVDAFNSMHKLITLTGILPSESPNPSGGASKGKKGGSTSSNSQVKQITDFMRTISKDLEPEGINTFLIDITNMPEHKVLIDLFTEYLRDESLTEISDKEFRLFGKVVHKIDAQTENPINLLQRSGLGGIAPEY